MAGGNRVPESASVSVGVAERYATAIFEISRDDAALDALEADMSEVADALGQSRELRDLIASPVVSRAEQKAAIGAVGKAMGLGAAMSNGLSLMADNRRLFVLPQLLAKLRGMIDDHKGETTAEVVSAAPLSEAQTRSLAEALGAAQGRTVRISASVDEDLVGGLVVKVGSRMVDTSIRSRLNAMRNAMKEV